MKTKFMRRAFALLLPMMFFSQAGFAQDVQPTPLDSENEELEVLSSKLSVFVRGFRFEGNTAFFNQGQSIEQHPFESYNFTATHVPVWLRMITFDEVSR